MADNLNVKKYDFLVPTKMLNCPSKMKVWMESEAYQDYLGN